MNLFLLVPPARTALAGDHQYRAAPLRMAIEQKAAERSVGFVAAHTVQVDPALDLDAP